MSARHYYAHVSSLELLEKYFDYLKENGVYDNTKIIIVSDHARTDFSPTPFDKWVDTANFIKFFYAILLIKDFNSKDKFEINTNFMTVAEVPYIATSHLEKPTNPFTGKVITNDQKNNGVILTEVHGLENAIKYNFLRAFKVHDNIFDENNWEEIELE